jgi:hypothetical protein
MSQIVDSLVLSFPQRSFRFNHGQRESKKKNNNNKKEENKKDEQILKCKE